MRLHQTKKLLHSKRNHQQSEKGLTDMNNSVVIAGRGRYKGKNANEKETRK